MKQVIDNQIFIYTIGHGSRKAMDFIYLLKRYGIEVVIDVRTYPYSRFHPQFRREELETALKSENIEYIFLGRELGGRPKDLSLYRFGKLNYDAVKQTKIFKEGIKQVKDLIGEDIIIALMCSEADQNQCHRKHMLADEFEENGIAVIHINKSGQLERNFIGVDLDLFD